jgi:hypothetical protein
MNLVIARSEATKQSSDPAFALMVPEQRHWMRSADEALASLRSQ